MVCRGAVFLFPNGATGLLAFAVFAESGEGCTGGLFFCLFLPGGGGAFGIGAGDVAGEEGGEKG